MRTQSSLRSFEVTDKVQRLMKVEQERCFNFGDICTWSQKQLRNLHPFICFLEATSLKDLTSYSSHMQLSWPVHGDRALAMSIVHLSLAHLGDQAL